MPVATLYFFSVLRVRVERLSLAVLIQSHETQTPPSLAKQRGSGGLPPVEGVVFAQFLFDNIATGQHPLYFFALFRARTRKGTIFCKISLFQPCRWGENPPSLTYPPLNIERRKWHGISKSKSGCTRVNISD